MDEQAIASAALTGSILGGPRESQEQVQYGIRTQFVVPAFQVLGIFIALGLVGGGLVLLGYSAYWLAITATTLLETALVAAMLGAGGLIVWRGVRVVLGKRDWSSSLWPLFLDFVITSVAVLGFLNLLEALARDWDWNPMLRLFGGISGCIAGSLFFYRMAQELWNPLYPPSPMVNVIREWFGRWASREEQQVEVVKPYPVKTDGGRLAGVGYANHTNQVEPEPVPEATLDPDFLDLTGLIHLANTHGLARAALVTRPRLTLPTGRPLTRDAYDRLMRLAQGRWGFVEKDDSGAWAWRMEPQDALAWLQSIIGEVRAGGQADGQAGTQGHNRPTAQGGEG